MAKKAKKQPAEHAAADTEKIISVNGKLVDNPEESKKRNAITVLSASMNNKAPITGRISGVESMQGGDPVAVMYVEGFKVLIPLQQCIDMPAQENSESLRDPKKYAVYLLQKRLGSEIDVIIRGYDAQKMIAVASRKMAMNQKRQEYFFGKDANGDYLLNEGQKVEARIVSAARPGIVVEIFGVETFMPAKELGYQRIQDCSRQFVLGSRIVVKLMGIHRNADGTVRVEASAREAMENPYIKAMKRYNVDDKYVGTVSMLDKNGIFVALDGGIDVLCAPPQRGPRPPRGTQVTIRITLKNEEQQRIFGLITHVARVGE